MHCRQSNHSIYYPYNIDIQLTDGRIFTVLDLIQRNTLLNCVSQRFSEFTCFTFTEWWWSGRKIHVLEFRNIHKNRAMSSADCILRHPPHKWNARKSVKITIVLHTSVETGQDGVSHVCLLSSATMEIGHWRLIKLIKISFVTGQT